LLTDDKEQAIEKRFPQVLLKAMNGSYMHTMRDIVVSSLSSLMLAYLQAVAKSIQSLHHRLISSKAVHQNMQARSVMRPWIQWDERETEPTRKRKDNSLNVFRPKQYQGVCAGGGKIQATGDW
jgi:hypothetical protein